MTVSRYTLLDPREDRRVSCDSLAEMVNTWFLCPSLVMVTVELSPEEAQVVNNIYGLHERLRTAERRGGKLRVVA